MSWFSRHFTLLATILCLLIYALTYLENAFGPPIRADGAGYYAYLPSILIYNDVSFERLAIAQYDGAIPPWTGIQRLPATGKYVDRYGIGVAIMMMPFFLLAHALTWLFQSPEHGFTWWKFNYPLDGYSLFYQHAAGLAGTSYLIAGLGVLRRVLRRNFSEGISLAVLTALLLGTNLLHYGSGESVTSHTYSFFLYALLLFLIPRWHEPDGGSLRLSFLVGCVAGLIALVRLPGVIVMMLMPLYSVQTMADLRSRVACFAGHWRAVLMMAAGFLVVFFPQMLIWKMTVGGLLANTYALQGEGFNFLNPAIIDILFSLKKGVLFWAPLLALCVPGFSLLRRHAPEWSFPVSLFSLVNLYIFSSWWNWWFGGSFGHRAFIESYPLFALALASVLATVRSPAARLALVAYISACVLWSLFFMKLYYTRELSFDGLDRQALFDIAWSRKEALLKALTTMRGN